MAQKHASGSNVFPADISAVGIPKPTGKTESEMNGAIFGLVDTHLKDFPKLGDVHIPPKTPENDEKGKKKTSTNITDTPRREGVTVKNQL